MVGFNLDVWIETEGTLTSDFRFGLADMFLVEEELTIQVTHVDCVQVDLNKPQC